MANRSLSGKPGYLPLNAVSSKDRALAEPGRWTPNPVDRSIPVAPCGGTTSAARPTVPARCSTLSSNSCPSPSPAAWSEASPPGTRAGRRKPATRSRQSFRRPIEKILFLVRRHRVEPASHGGGEAFQARQKPLSVRRGFVFLAQSVEFFLQVFDALGHLVGPRFEFLLSQEASLISVEDPAAFSLHLSQSPLNIPKLSREKRFIERFRLGQSSSWNSGRSSGPSARGGRGCGK